MITSIKDNAYLYKAKLPMTAELHRILEVFCGQPKDDRLQHTIDAVIDNYVHGLSIDGKIALSFVEELSDFIKGTVRIL